MKCGRDGFECGMSDCRECNPIECTICGKIVSKYEADWNWYESDGEYYCPECEHDSVKCKCGRLCIEDSAEDNDWEYINGEWFCYICADNLHKTENNNKGE